MTHPMRVKSAGALCTYWNLFFLVSFLGWAGETVYAWIWSGGWQDRGFLRLPFCPLYGTAVLVVYALLGTPREGGLLLGRVKKPVSRLFLYWFLATALSTVAELITGWFFHRFFSVRLWDYSGKLWNVGGYICLPFSLMWGTLLFVMMRWCFFPLLRTASALPRKAAWTLAGVLSAATVTDLILCIAKQ